MPMLMGQEIAVETATENKPRHIAIIMDGNGRWAKKRGLPRVAGHRRGVEMVKNMVPICGKRGIPYLTLFAFSSENWRRPSTEVKLLIELLHTTLETEMRRLHEHKVRLRVIGDLSRFPQKLQRKIDEAHQLTRDNKALNLTIAINYGGQWDMTQACRSLAELVEKGELSPQAITPALIESHLCTHELPPPDLFVRTGGEKRISNFLLWQLAYTELYFCDTYWPDFNEASVDQALAYFAGRQRRFGKTGEQVATRSDLA
ncbi:MAG: isoprenyl transferase [Gammaproteobacteria bacterium]